MKKKIIVRFGIIAFLLCSFVYAQNDTLKVVGATGEIGTTDHVVPINLKNNVHIIALQMTLNYPNTSDLSPQDVSATSRLENFIVAAETQDTPGEIPIVIYSNNLDETIPPDTGSVLEIRFDVLPDASPGYYPLSLSNIIAIDQFRRNVAVDIVDGVFTITSGFIPVELAAFSGEFLRLQNKVKLSWRTASESNNYGFEILRGENKEGLEKIGFMPGQSTTSTPHEYDFLDANISSAYYIYQLKQIDFDGTTQLSEQIEVNISSPETYQLSQNYPNPFSIKNSGTNTFIHFQLSQPEHVDIRIYDLMGREVKTLLSQETPGGTHTIQWDGKTNQGLSACNGVYYYTMKTKNFTASKKMIIF